MKFEYIPKTNVAKASSYIKDEDRFYSFVEDYGIIGVRWSQPKTISANYFMRLLLEGSASRARGFSRFSRNNQNDEDSSDLEKYYIPLLDHGALWKLSGGQVICTAMPYGDEAQILRSFEDLLEKYKFPRTIKLDFLDDKYRYRSNGDYMIVIYNDDSSYGINTDLSIEQVKSKAIQQSSYEPKRYETSSGSYVRNRYVSEYAKRRANGICQLCGQPAPFMDGNGEPYLEAHHVKWLGDGGSDSIDNTVALCPNCHRKMHSLNLPADVDYLLGVIKEMN